MWAGEEHFVECLDINKGQKCCKFHLEETLPELSLALRRES
jgi:hypothetical protein